MPTYDYKCGDCGYEFDRILKMDNYKKPESENCPECGAYEVKRHMKSAPQMKTRVGVDDFRKNLPDDFKETMRRIKKGNPDNKRGGFNNQMKDYSSQ